MEALAVAAPWLAILAVCLLWQAVHDSGNDPWDDLHR
jgi:hypothetical protein